MLWEIGTDGRDVLAEAGLDPDEIEELARNGALGETT